jgi:hypothetical protein
MAKEPTEKEIEEFKEKQGKLYDDIKSYEREKEVAFDKKNSSIYNEAERKTANAEKEIAQNNADWNKKWGGEEKEQENDEEYGK